ncbi:hypothetical protein [Desmospora activa]|uniref:Rho termination factor-like protein n=1 Tax=Desmospora activa DSM 45169 TaxID=1121389 RepID=A0A2T4Z905_9BACL|nr:hypothetical protein [Desmospora activa]PTM58376.1 hypothetical protein C8J48_0958 [Desmospora activa DSM 45169]
MGLISFDQTKRLTKRRQEVAEDPAQMTKRELRALAEKRGIDLSEVADRKSDLIAAIREGRA